MPDGPEPRSPSEVYRSGVVRALENAAADYACLTNDVFSYQKEIEYEGEMHNAILVVQNFFGCDYPTALGIVHDLMTQRMQQFEHIIAHDLPVLCDDFDLSSEAREAMGSTSPTCGTGCRGSCTGTARSTATSPRTWPAARTVSCRTSRRPRHPLHACRSPDPVTAAARVSLTRSWLVVRRCAG